MPPLGDSMSQDVDVVHSKPPCAVRLLAQAAATSSEASTWSNLPTVSRVRASYYRLLGFMQTSNQFEHPLDPMGSCLVDTWS